MPTISSTRLPATSTSVVAKAPKFQEPKCDISLPPRLGRPPKTSDLIIKKGWDGKTPEAALKTVLSKLQKTKVHPSNVQFVNAQINSRFRDFSVALNNVFTPNSPNRLFIDGLKPAKVEVLASMTDSRAISYKLTDAAGAASYYTRDMGGRFVPLKDPPKFVIMSAELRLSKPGLIMQYPKWSAPALGGPLSTVVEL